MSRNRYCATCSALSPNDDVRHRLAVRVAKRIVTLSVKESSITNFGLVIAFLLPGFVALWGVGYAFEPVRSWFGTSADNAPTVGGFLYVTLASVVAGLTVSTVRWLAIDTLHHYTGVALPAWDFSRLQENVAAFDVLVDIHYRFYLFYANMLIAIVFTTLMRHLTASTSFLSLDQTDAVAVALALVFFAGSRDTLSKYYRRGEAILAQRPQQIGRPTRRR